MICSYLRDHAEGVVVALQVQPRSSRNQLMGVQDGKLKVKLTSPPVEGAANKACCAFVAKLIGVAKSRVVIVSGETSRQKRVLIKGISPVEAQSAITLALKES